MLPILGFTTKDLTLVGIWVLLLTLAFLVVAVCELSDTNFIYQGV